MEPPVKRIGDVTIERVSSVEKRPKNDIKSDDSSIMNFSSESDSENPLSEDETSDFLNTEYEYNDKSISSNSEPSTSQLQSIKRKNEFEVDELNPIPKKLKNLNPSKSESNFVDEHENSDDDNGADDEFMNLDNINELNKSVSENISATDNKNENSRTRMQSDNEDSEYDSEEDSDTENPIQTLKTAPVFEAEKTDFIEKLASEFGEPSCPKSEDEKVDADYNYDIAEKLKEMGEISVETVKKGDKTRKSEVSDEVENEISVTPAKKDSGSDSDDKNSSERKIGNMRRNIREVMDETQLDEATLAAQRQEMERLRRVQEQQRIIREVQRQIALNRQNQKTQHRVISLLQGNSSLIKQVPGTSGSSTSTSGVGSSSVGAAAGRIGGTVLVKLPNGETKPMTRITKGSTPFEVVRLQKGAMQGKMQRNLIPIKKTSGGNLTPSVSIAPVAKKIEPKIGESDSESEVSDSERKIRKVADVVTISSSSDDDCIVLSEEEPEEPEPEEDPCNSGMHTNDSYNVPDEQGRVLINVGHPENESDIFLAPQIARVIKPHQIGGVRFLYDNVIESTERFSTSTGFGCILAHSMGLGKTLQIVCFSDIFLRHTNAKTILCIMPINTLQNWLAEYNMWLPKDPINSPLLSHGEVRPRNFNLYVLNDSHKTLAARAKVIQEWHREGGVLLIGYELYRLLSLRRNPKSKSKRKKPGGANADDKDTPEDEEKNKSLFEEIHEALVKPGPDLVICDEGHRIKNSHASISQALKQIRSKRRIVLTGYPLQNNLLEYWCMVDFVRPNYLGTKTEFSNMFERPIQNGQCIDSTPQDIRLMRYRAHVLHSLLEGFVQRRSHAVLQTSLPQKEEYVLLVRMTEFQRKLYDTFMNEVVRTKTVPNPLKAFAVCCKIWNHPDVLYYFLKKQTTGETVDLDLEEVAGATGSAPATPATPKKGSSRSKGGAKKEKKTATSKNANSKPAASVTPNTNASTTPSNTLPTVTNPVPAPNLPATTTSTNAPPPAIPNMNIPPNIPQNPSNPPSNYNQMNQNYPNSSYPNNPYPNYQQYPQNGDYYNQNPNYPNNYNPSYYPNQEYGGFYDGNNKPESGYMQPFQQDNQQNYWNASGNNSQQQNPQQQYYNQNGPQGDYYGNMNQQPGYGNQDYYRQNQYNQNYPQNNMYPPNTNPYQQNQQWPQQPPPNQPPQQMQQSSQMEQQSSQPQQQQMPDFNNKPQEFKPEIKQEFKTEFKQEYNPEFNSMMKPKDETKPVGIDTIKTDDKLKNAEDEKKVDGITSEANPKDEIDDKDKDPEKVAELPALAKVTKEDPGIPYDWAHELMKGYLPGCIENSAKMEIFFCILQESMALGDRILLFSQSLFTLNLIEEFLQRYDVPGTEDKWAKNKHYYRLDGSTSALEREKLINEYNSNPNIHLFLVSTRAGSLGINLVGANRVIVFDASWNPCHDTQAVCRVYRYGQKKPCFVYRVVMDNCLEKKIYDRQINKQGMADRVVDECNPDAHLSMKDVTNLCWDDEKDSEVKDFSTTKDKYIDVVMQKVLDSYSNRLSKEPFQHESLLIDRKEKKLSQAEKRLAKRSYELEKQANINSRPTYSYYNSGSGQGLQIRAIRTQDGVLQNKPIASVRPMQSEQMVRDLGRPGTGQGRSRWIPAEVWQRQGMTAQEMTLPLDVVIPTNSPDRGSIVLKAGQKVLVLKSPKGIYMQLECGKIVAIKTAFKVRGGKAPDKGEEGANKEHSAPTTILKKVSQTGNTSKNMSNNVPLPLKNNTAITVIPKGGQQRMVKPFTQGVTKLNMRSIRQPVPNLIGRQMPMRMGGPRFTGKIQSIQRKVQLAKAKPYNLDKIGESFNPIDPSKIKSEPADVEPEPHVVPSSDEEIPIESQGESSEKKGESLPEECPENEQFHANEMYPESEKSMENCSDMERLSNNDYPESNIDRRPSTESYQSTEKSSDNFTNLDQFPNQDKFASNEQFQNPEEFHNPNFDQFQNRDKFSNPSHSKFSNQEFRQDKFQNTNFENPNVEQNPDKYPQEMQYQQLPEKYPNSNQEKYSTLSNTMPDKYPNSSNIIPERYQNPAAMTPDRYQNSPSTTPDRYQNPSNANSDRYQNPPNTTPERYQNPPNTTPEKYQNPPSVTPDRYQNPTSVTPDRYQNPPSTTPDRYQSPPNATPERYQNPANTSPEKYQNPPSSTLDKYQNPANATLERYQNPPSNSSDKYQNPPNNPPERYQNPPNTTPERYQNPPNTTSDRYQNPPSSNIEKYPNPQSSTIEKYQNPPSATLDKYQSSPNATPDRYQNPPSTTPDRYQNAPNSTPERYQNPPSNTSEKYQNPPSNSSEKYQNPPNATPERYQNAPNNTSDKYQNSPNNPPDRYQNTASERYQNPPSTSSDKYHNTPSTTPDRYPNSELYPSAEKYPMADKFSAPSLQPQQTMPERYTVEQYQNNPTVNKFIPPPPTNYQNIERFSNVDYQKMEKYPKIESNIQVPNKELSDKPLITPVMDKPKPITSYPNTIQNPPLPIPSPVVTHETGNTNRSLKNYRHNFASQKAHNQGIKPLPKVTTTSSALHQLEQTTSSIGENKQPFQESLDNITNSYGANLPGDSKHSEDSTVIDLDAEKDEPIVEKTNKSSSSKPSHQPSHIQQNPIIPPEPLKPPPIHHTSQPSAIKPDINQQQPPLQSPHHPPSQQQPQQQLPPPIVQQPPAQHPQSIPHPMQPLHPAHPQLQHGQPPHGHGHQQQDFGGSYGGYYGYGAPHVQPYPPPPQPYYNPTDITSQFQDMKSKIEKPSTNVSQTSTNTRSEPIQSSTSTPSIIPPSPIPTPSALSTPSPITTPHHTGPISAPYSNINNIASTSNSIGNTNSSSVNVTANMTSPGNNSSQPPNPLPPPAASVVPPPAPTVTGFAPYGQPGMPPPPPHGAYDMMGYPQQNQYSANYPGLPYPNQPNYQPPYQPPAAQYDQGAPAGAYPPGPAPPNMYSAFHRPDVHHQYGTDPYAQPHYAAAVRNPYPPQYAYPPPPPTAQNVYGATPTPGPAPGYDYQYNANGFPPPPPFVNPYAGLPNNNPVP